MLYPTTNLWGSLQARQARKVVGLLAFKGAHVDEDVQLDVLRSRQQKTYGNHRKIVVFPRENGDWTNRKLEFEGDFTNEN